MPWRTIAESALLSPSKSWYRKRVRMSALSAGPVGVMEPAPAPMTGWRVVTGTVGVSGVVRRAIDAALVVPADAAVVSADAAALSAPGASG